MNKEKIIGIYRYKENGKDMFCYIVKDEKGRVSPFITDKLDVIKEKFVRYAKDNGYNKANIKDMLESDSFDLNCTSYDDFKEKAATLIANGYLKRKSKEETVEKQGLLARLHNKINNVVDNVKTKFKESKIVKNVKVRRAAIAALGLAVAIGAVVALNKHNGPTSDNSKVVVDDNIDEDEDKEIDQDDNNLSLEVNENQEIKEETTSSISNNRDEKRRSSSISSPNITSTPGSVNENYSSFQDPNASIDDNTNNNTSDNSNSNAYDNVIDEEVPVDDNKNDNDYSEEIDIPAEGDQNLVQDDVILDDKFIGNEGAIDDDISYETVESNESTLPDPNETANTTDGDYNTTQEELVNEQAQDTTTGQVEEIPVEQEATSTNSDIIGQAVEAMEKGQDVDIVYNAETGNMYIEENTTPTLEETNSYTK